MGEQQRARDKTPDEKIDEAREQGASDEDRTEKPEPEDEHKEKAADMMTAYEDRPTLILPGTGGAVSGTAVGDWLDDDGNPKGADDEDAPAAKAKADADKDEADEKADEKADDAETDDISSEEKVEKDKEFNAAVLKAAEDDKAAKADKDKEDHKDKEDDKDKAGASK
jgi:hypothetical protein